MRSEGWCTWYHQRAMMMYALTIFPFAAEFELFAVVLHGCVCDNQDVIAASYDQSDMTLLKLI